MQATGGTLRALTDTSHPFELFWELGGLGGIGSTAPPHARRWAIGRITHGYFSCFGNLIKTKLTRSSGGSMQPTATNGSVLQQNSQGQNAARPAGSIRTTSRTCQVGALCEMGKRMAKHPPVEDPTPGLS